MASIFDLLKHITSLKTDWSKISDEEKEYWNNYMINRFISMSEDYVDIVNIIQKHTWQMEPEKLYKIYKEVIPKKQVFLKYIKAKNKKEFDKEEVNIISNYFEISNKEAKEYILIMPKEELKEILDQFKQKK
jgi:hypothetical protein